MLDHAKSTSDIYHLGMYGNQGAIKVVSGYRSSNLRVCVEWRHCVFGRSLDCTRYDDHNATEERINHAMDCSSLLSAVFSK